jgi:rhamnosyl/mannosyltransferase
MRIVHVYKDFDPPVRGGIERHMALMCRYQRRWADVQALTCSRTLLTRRTERDGTPVTEVGEWGRLQSAPVSPGFPLWYRRLQADVWVVHVPNPTGELGWLLARPRGALVVRYHSDVVRQALAMRAYRPLQLQFLAKAAMILPTSRAYLDTSPVLQAAPGPFECIPLGIEAGAYQRPRPDKVAALRASHGGAFVFFCGRHRYYKGLRHLVQAAAAIDAAVVIGGDGPESTALRRQAAESGGRVVFSGPLDHQDLVDHLHACAVFAFPSVARSEAFGMSLLEAHAAGRPAVATRLGTGVEMVNRDGETGFNVPPGDAAALAEAVNRLLAETPLRDAMGRAARERVEREFRADVVARREFECYRRLVSGDEAAGSA